jgi:hypothetical protein
MKTLAGQKQKIDMKGEAFSDNQSDSSGSSVGSIFDPIRELSRQMSYWDSRSLNDSLGPQLQDPKVTFVLLTCFCCLIGIVSWMTLFQMTALEGPKLYNGMVCGSAECIASLLVGVIMMYLNDLHSCFISCLLCFGCNVIYRLMGAGDSGFLGLCVLFCSVLGIGALVNAMYIVIELRVPAKSLGAAMVIMMTGVNIISGFAPTLAYLP